MKMGTPSSGTSDNFQTEPAPSAYRLESRVFLAPASVLLALVGARLTLSLRLAAVTHARLKDTILPGTVIVKSDPPLHQEKFDLA